MAFSPDARRSALRSHCRPKIRSRPPTTTRRTSIGRAVIAGPATPTMRASARLAAPAPTSAERQPRATPAARTMVSASTISTPQARKAVSASSTADPVTRQFYVEQMSAKSSIRAELTGTFGPSLREDARARARELGLLGWVRLDDDGVLRVHAEGERVEELADWLRAAPGAGALEVKAAKVEGHEQFAIRGVPA